MRKWQLLVTWGNPTWTISVSSYGLRFALSVQHDPAPYTDFRNLYSPSVLLNWDPFDDSWVCGKELNSCNSAAGRGSVVIGDANPNSDWINSSMSQRVSSKEGSILQLIWQKLISLLLLELWNDLGSILWWTPGGLSVEYCLHTV